MSYKKALGGQTIPVTVASNGDMSTGTPPPGTSHYLVVGISCFDQNGVHRVLDCTTDSYMAYIANVAGAEAVNGHVKLLPFQVPIDENALLSAATTYKFDLLSGIAGPVTNAYISRIAYGANEPQAPAPTTPAQNATGVLVIGSFAWVAIGDADSYEVQICTNSGFSAGVTSATTLSASLTSGLAAATEYWWRVRAANAAGLSPWSTPFHFTTA